MGSSPETLYDTGNVYVTLAATRAFAAHESMREEEARRELTRLLCEAQQKSTDGELELWRYRSRSTGLDISARVARYGCVALVVAVNVRKYS